MAPAAAYPALVDRVQDVRGGRGALPACARGQRADRRGTRSTRSSGLTGPTFTNHDTHMRRLPAGTVTLLFTDIEGSTRALQSLGDGYVDALADHRRTLRAAFERNGGTEVDTAGDGFFVAFGRASHAVAAARDGQAALDGGPIRVRMGIHTGEPTVTHEGYVGLDVHKAARIMGAGHGGQVLISEATRQLLESGFELCDLGAHRL